MLVIPELDYLIEFMIIIANPFRHLTNKSMNGITTDSMTQTALNNSITAFILERSIVSDDCDSSMGRKLRCDL